MKHIITSNGFTFMVNTSEQANRLTQQLREMTYNQTAKLHREIYGSTQPAKRGRKVLNG